MHLLFILIPGKIVALFAGLYFLRQLTLPYKLLLCQVLIAIISECYGYYTGYILHQNNVWIFSYYMLLDSWLLGLAGRSFVSSKILKTAIPLSLVVTTLIWMLDSYKTNFSSFSNVFFVSYSILLIIVYITALTNRTFGSRSLFLNPVFWIGVSSIVYYGCILPYITLLNYLHDTNPGAAFKLWDINLILNFIRYPLVALAFYLVGRRQLAEQRAL